MKRKTLKCIHRFMGYVPIDDDGCWEWRGAKDRQGYGQFALRKHEGGHGQVKAHRLSFEFFNGPIPDEHGVCHRCDNPACVNPAHLFAGSVLENNRDSRTKGRGHVVSLRGDSNPRAKLVASQVLEIRALHGHFTYKQIAQRFGVSFGTIDKIMRRETWRYLQEGHSNEA